MVNGMGRVRIKKYKVDDLDRIPFKWLASWNEIYSFLGGADSLPLERRFRLELKARSQKSSEVVRRLTI